VSEVSFIEILDKDREGDIIHHGKIDVIWHLGWEAVVLHGQFSPKELRELADYIDTQNHTFSHSSLRG